MHASCVSNPYKLNIMFCPYESTHLVPVPIPFQFRSNIRRVRLCRPRIAMRFVNPLTVYLLWRMFGVDRAVPSWSRIPGFALSSVSQ